MCYRSTLLFCLLCLSANLNAQFNYHIDSSVPVEVDGKILSLAWAGGLNSAQFNKMDLNGDGKDDLVIFERTANKVLTFLDAGGVWRHEPYYEPMFPPAIDQWMLLRDFNCDGKKDIFTHDTFGIAVFVNISSGSAPLQWRPFNPGFPLLTIGFSGATNLQVNGTDIPGIDDIDGDGDLDILDARFAGIGSIEYHRNMSVENTGKCDSMQLVRVTQAWGNFEECNCGEYLYGGDNCDVFGGRTQHAAGKSILTIDVDNDGDRDLLFSEETCTQIYFLQNFGTRDSANMTGFTTFPDPKPIVNFSIFPATYFEDLDFDGVSDLIMSSNTYNRSDFSINFRNSAWFYKNTGTNALPVFTFVKDNILQDEMIEVGDNAAPAFADEDGDGDLDLFISSFNSTDSVSYLYYFQNTGSVTAPSFKFITNNYAGISGESLYNLKIQFADFNNDGSIDLVFTATSLSDGITSLYYINNKSRDHIEIIPGEKFNALFTISPDENIALADVNKDGLKDLLVGKSSGALQYWKNTGPAATPGFTLENAAFMGLGVTTDRQNPVVFVSDLDSDGKDDMILGDQRGVVSIFADYRTVTSASAGEKNIVWDSLSQSYASKNLGGRVWPVAVNLYNSTQPAIVVGNLLGGIQMLKNAHASELPHTANVTVFPNPVISNSQGDKIVYIRSDQNVTAQMFSLLGQKITDTFSVTGGEDYPVTVNALASGVYIIQFSTKLNHFSRRVIVR